MLRIASFRVAVSKHALPRCVCAVHIAGSAAGGGADNRALKTPRAPTHSPTHELSVTSTNDIVDAVIRRALHSADDTSENEFGDEHEHHGTKHAEDSALLDALSSRWHDLTVSEASDVLHAVGRSSRFQRLDTERGRLLDNLARQDGPFHAIVEMYLDESLPMAWMRPNRHARRPAAKKPTDRELSDFMTDMSKPAWSGSPPKDEWHGLPYQYSVCDIARLVFSIASFTKPSDQHGIEDRALLAKAAAHVAANFSRDAWTREHASEGDLATLVWAFAEIPQKLQLHSKHQDVFLHKACRRALRELAHPVKQHHQSFTAEEIFTTAMAYERAYDECWLEVQGVGAEAADSGSESPGHVTDTVNPTTPFAAARARAAKALANAKGDDTSDTSEEEETPLDTEETPRGDEQLPISDVDDKSSTLDVAFHTSLFRQTPLFFSSVADGRSSANHVLQALAPEALHRTTEFSSQQLGYIADACARFGVHPKGEGMWEWDIVVRKRRKEEQEEQEGKENVLE